MPSTNSPSILSVIVDSPGNTETPSTPVNSAAFPPPSRANSESFPPPSRSNSGSEILRLSLVPKNSSVCSLPNTIHQRSTESLLHNRPPSERADSNENLADCQEMSTTLIIVGRTAKTFTVHNERLKTRSPQFAKYLAHEFSSSEPYVARFPELNEFSFALFVRYIYGAKLSGPSDFHTMQHYVGLYCLARQFEIEPLANLTMDLVRAYYRSEDMTAPPFRLKFIYSNTKEQCPMRQFLVYTAAYRVLRKGRLSQVMKDLVEDGGQLAIDLMNAAVVMHAEGVPDPRQGHDCQFHEHLRTEPCHSMSTRASSGTDCAVNMSAQAAQKLAKVIA